MKLFSSLILLAVLACAPLHASSYQVWAGGVSQESGWIDYEKTTTKGDGDDNLCWAASTSSVLDYWQSLYVTSSTTPTGEGIWNRYKEAAKDMGGNFISATQWWLGGDYSGETLLDDNEKEPETTINNRALFKLKPEETAITTDLTTFGGYYWETIPETYNGTDYPGSKQEHLANFFWGIYEGSEGYNFSTALVSLIAEATPMSLAIVDTKGELAHAITLWGAEYETDDTGNANISSIWITDSDDYKHQLRKLDTYYKGEENRLYLSEYSSYSKYGEIYIAEAYGLNTEESDTWALQRIPEPTTATLSLAAVAALGARRRRK